MDWGRMSLPRNANRLRGDLDAVPDQRLVAEMTPSKTPIVTTECVSTQLPLSEAQARSARVGALTRCGFAPA